MKSAKPGIQPSGKRKVWLWGLAGAAGLIVLAYLGVGRPFRAKGTGAFRDANVLLFTLDTTRADHLGCYGDTDARTSNIDRLAAEGVRFSNAAAQAPLTLPSHASLLTGTYPFVHGVRDNGGFYLDAAKTTLAEVLEANGWATGAFIGAFVLDSRWGLNQGFSRYFDDFDLSVYKKASLDSVQRRGGDVVGAFLDWFEGLGGRRFFGWVHLYDPHTPYDPPEPYRGAFAGRPWGLYDGEIAYVDSLVGKVIERLREKGVLERTIVVVAADHGESLGEHNESAHGFFIYDATISVPLVLRLPGRRHRGTIVKSQVENVDIMPTILDLVGLDVPREVQGTSLVPLLGGRRADPERMAYSESYYPRFHYGWSEIKSLRNVSHRYVQAPRPELYDLVQDPGETKNVLDRNVSLAAKFAAALKAREEGASARAGREPAPEPPDDETMEKLRALGYIGGFTSSSRLQASSGLADPKDKILLYNKLKQAEAASARTAYDEALKGIGEVIAEDPGIMEARLVKAQIDMDLERYEDAVRECRAALEIDPEYGAAVFTMAQAYKRLGMPREAAAGYHRLIQLDPKDPKPYLNLGEIALETGDLDAGISYLGEAIAADPDRSAVARNLLGSAYLKKGRFDEAGREILRALELRPLVPDAHYHLGLLYEAKGDIPRAAEEYRKEIEIHPGAYTAHFNLALVSRKMGDREGESRHLEEAIRANPRFARAYLFLAKAILDRAGDLEEAIRLVRKGLDLEPDSASAPLGHYILADIYDRLGRASEYLAELEKGRALEAAAKKR